MTLNDQLPAIVQLRRSASVWSTLAHKIKAADESLRVSFAGLDVDEIVPEVERSLTALGTSLPGARVREYAQHISDRAAYELVLE